MDFASNFSRILINILILSTTACQEGSEKSNLQNKKQTVISTSKLNRLDSLSNLHKYQSELYTHAIAEFIKAAYKNDNTTFDTLYFGKRRFGQTDDFPDIELASEIEGTQIRLISPELGEKIQRERKSVVYINLIGWINSDNADFIFIVFKDGMKHQFDYFINFEKSPSSGEMQVSKIEFECYLPSYCSKSKRQILYKNGTYLEGH